MSEMRLTHQIRLQAPAKVNLGLEVVARRPDGYHEIVSILQAVNLCDEILLSPAEHFSYEPDPQVPADQDLTLCALRLAEERLGLVLMGRVRLTKRIPLAAGLGGGSSDAGTLLAALGAMAGVAPVDLSSLAAELGSDVPFFLRGGTALATGTGTTLQPLPTGQPIWFVIVTPGFQIPGKTAVLYRSLGPGDFSDGAATRANAVRLAHKQEIDPAMIRSTFARPLFEDQRVNEVAARMRQAGAGPIVPSGAGPSLFSLFNTKDRADEVAATLTRQGLAAIVCTNIGPELNAEPLRGPYLSR